MVKHSLRSVPVTKSKHSAPPNRTCCKAGVLAIVCLALATAARPHHEFFEYEVKAAFLFNFARFTQWPASAFGHEDAVRLCVLGRDPFGRDLDKLEGKTVEERPVLVRRLSHAPEARHCQIVFISHSQRAEIRAALEVLKGASVLTVGEAPDFLEMGGMVRLLLEGDRVRFEINLGAAEGAHLKLSSKLLSLAKSVRG
jgi:hypothetical protein